MSSHGLRAAVCWIAILLAAAPAVAGLCPMSADCPMRRAETVADCHGAPGAEAADDVERPPAGRHPAETECCAAHTAPERSATAAAEPVPPPEVAAGLPAGDRALLVPQVVAGVRPPWPPLPPLLPREGSASLCTLHVAFLN